MVTDIKDVAIRNGPNSSRLHAVHANGNISIGNIADVYGVVKSKVESQIFPNEFWDQTVTYEESAQITKDYLEYCNDLGFLHRFSGTVPSNGRLVPAKGYNEKGERVQLTDLAYKYDENGNQTSEVEPFFWKVLTDRRMYDNSGNYLPQKRVTLNDTTTDTVTGFAKNNQGRQYDKAKAEALAKKITKGEQYSEHDVEGFKDYNIVSAVYTIRNEKAKRGHDLVEIGNMPTLYRKLFGLSGDVYVSNEHLYQNMVSRATAETEGRFDPDASADYHELGEEKVINAIEQFQDPLVIMESLKDFDEPRLVAILEEKGNDGDNLIAVLELYSKQRPHGVSQKRNHVLITIYEKNSLPDYIEKTVDKNRVLHIKEGSRQISQAGLQLSGEISAETLAKNVARFNKKVKAFKEKNKIYYSSQETDADYMDAVNRGDMETVQRMVETAARSAEYEATMFHETDAENIHIFDISRGTHGGTDYQTPYGIFTKSSGKNIGLGSKQMELLVKARNTLRAENREDVLNKIPGFAKYYDQIQAIDKKYDAISNQLEDEELDALQEWMEEHPDVDMDDVFPLEYIAEGKPADIDYPKYLEAHEKYTKNRDEWIAKYDAVAVKAKAYITNYLRLFVFQYQV